ncbi:mycothiol transferase [Flindersiella endophytica]
MSNQIVLGTSFDDVPAPATEADGLLFAIERVRAQFAWKIGGVDSAGLNQPHPPSTMTLGGLIKHMAGCEERMIATCLTGEPLPAPWDAVDHDEDRDWEWRTAADDTPEELYTLWQAAVDRSRKAVAEVLADGPLDQPSKLTWPDGLSPNRRRILIDLIEHYLRHTGHADLLREAIDGVVGEDPPR